MFFGGSPGTGGVSTFGGWAAIGGVSTLGGSSATGATGPGYYTSGPWAGYAWTATSGTGTTISPADFSAHIAGTPFCTLGIVAATGDYMLGFNLNQAPDSALLGTWTPASITYGGVQISITNTSGSSLRVQIDGPNGSTDANDRWCANITGSGAVIPWGAFNTACWDDSGTFYAGQPLVSVRLLVLTPNDTPVRFSFCVDNITPAGTGWSNPLNCPAAQPAVRAYCSLSDGPCHYANQVCVCGQFYSTDYQWLCGSAGTGGTGGATCTSLCTRVVAAACPNDTLSSCVTDCQSVQGMSSGCPSQFNAFLGCLTTATLTCSSSGTAVATGCDTQGTALNTCLDGVPAAWSCTSYWYGTDDGCDCGCTVADPDCAGAGCVAPGCNGAYLYSECVTSS
jgi:hypothetical protein